jgi:hypothetical protein
MIIDSMEFDDDLYEPGAHDSLWQSVLMVAIEDALFGCRTGYRPDKVAANQEARDYVLLPNDDFDLVCALAGFDAQTVRLRVSRMISRAPSAADLASTPKKVGRHRGDCSNFYALQGTGAGSTAQETPKITFSEEAENA